MFKNVQSKNVLSCVLVGLIFLFMTGCVSSKKSAKDGPPKTPVKNLDRIPNAIPKAEPLSRHGNRFKNNSNSYVAKKKRYHVLSTSRGYKARGHASWYGTKFHGRKTSSGEPYDMYAMTAAHRTLPLPTYAKVTNLSNGKSIVVKINDRGPFHKDRIIDLSYVAAHKLGMLGKGTSKVEVESIDPRDNRHSPYKRRKAATVISKSNQTNHTSKVSSRRR